MAVLNRHRLVLLCIAALGVLLLGIRGLLTSDEPVVTRVSEPAPALPAAAPAVRDETARTPHRHSVPADGPLKADSDFGTLRGRVIDAATGKPVREFVVGLPGHQQTKYGKELPGDRRFTSPDGRFEWDYALPGEWTITIDATGYQRFQIDSLSIAAGKATEEVLVPMRRGHRIQGRVSDAASGAGIPSARLSFRESHIGRYEGNFRTRPFFTADENGFFVLEGVPDGEVTVSAFARGYAGREIKITAGGKTGPLEVALSTGGLVAGRLTAADGHTPVAGQIGILYADDAASLSQPTTPSGEFRFENLSPGRYLLRGETSSGVAEREVTITGNERIEGLILAVESRATLRGVVSGLSREELSGVSLYVHPDSDRMMFMSPIMPGAGGAFVIQVKPGKQTLYAYADGRRISLRLDVPEGADMMVNVAFPQGTRLSGRITRRGEPLANAAVHPEFMAGDSFHVDPRTTSADGQYAFDGIKPGEYRIGVGSYTSDIVRVSGDTKFDIDLLETQRIAGRVVEQETGIPVVAALVRFSVTDKVRPVAVRQVSTDHYGRFELLQTGPGAAVVTIYKPGYELVRERIQPGSVPADLTIPLRRDPGVEIRVYAADTGDPVRRINVMDEDTGLWLQIPLHEGSGYLPVGLSGSTLRFHSGIHAPLVIRNWDGQPLTLRFKRATEGRP